MERRTQSSRISNVINAAGVPKKKELAANNG
jgi:hypothetical protein